MKQIVFLAYLVISILMVGCSKKPAPDHVSIYEEIRYADKMEFASMDVTKTIKTERTDWYKLGKRIAVYSYDTHLKAYIDLSQFEPDDLEFDEKNKTVRVTLPPIKVEIAGRDMELKKEYENIGIFRTDIDPKERAKLKEMANTSLKKELDSNPEFKKKLIDAGRRKARIYFETLLKNAGYTPIIRFSDDPSPQSDYKSPLNP